MAKSKSDPTVFIRGNTPEKKKLITDLMKETSIKTSTGAFEYAAKSYLQQKKKISLLEKENTQITNELSEVKEMINRFTTINGIISEYAKKTFVKGKYPQRDLF